MIEDQKPTAEVESHRNESGEHEFRLSGRLDSATTGEVWRTVDRSLQKDLPRAVVVDAAGIEYCDMAGAALLLNLEKEMKVRGGTLEIRNLPEQFTGLLNLFDDDVLDSAEVAEPKPSNLVEETGRATVAVWETIRDEIAFLGELTVALFYALFHPWKVRWKDAFLVAETAGVNSLPIITLIGFMVGWIIAFQAAIPMKMFGAEIFVADLIAIVMLRELGPMMSALILAGRTGSAFAAEIGTMKVNEEIDALTTMGLDPVRFLVTTRVIAASLMTPLLVAFSNLAGVIGGALVLLSMGYPLVTYVDRVMASVGPVDLIGGLVKSVVFGFIVAGIGCARGLRTKTGASAVGESTTTAVVAAVILIILVDALFGLIYYSLGI